ncbi:MAG TPA: hypothetical protein ENK43_12635 [Planctomycetes bacterium]|nr:hypothetical protein [Planctomycetota bacterium]
MNQFLESRELVRRLKQGAPIEVDGEVVRLPRFAEIQEMDPEELGGKGDQDVIIAKARTATWCLWPLDRRSKFSKKDGECFLSMLDAVQENIPQKPVMGWVFTTGPVADESRKALEDKGHRIHRIPV